ncbi:ankyrin repeat-containing domain protein, partial [Cladorrhinum sp. PSN332]
MDLFLDAKDSIRDQILHLGVKRSILNWGTLFNFAAKYRLNCDSRDSLGRTLLMNSIYVSDAALAERILVCQRDCTPSCYQGGGWGSKRTSKRYTQCFNQDHSSLCHPCHQRDPTGKTPLMIAATAGCGRIVTVILYFGESLPNAQDSSGLNALMHAANRELEVEEAPDSSAFVYLYNHDRINRDITDEKGRTYLMYAARWGREDIIGAVYDKYNTANAVDERGRTALLYSILEVTKHDKEKVPKDQFNRYLVCLEYILCMKDIDINIVDDDGNSKFSVLQWETVKSGRVPLDQQTMATWETKDMLRFIFEVLQNPLGDKIGARNGSPSN